MTYIYPPRPENKIAPASLVTFEKMGKFLAEPKLNGSSMQIYFDKNGNIEKIMNRHKQPMDCKMDRAELKALYRGKGEMILCGEYLNKNQKDENGKPWNIQYVIWDIIMYEGKHLLGSTFEERMLLLAKIYPSDVYEHFVRKISANCFRITSRDFGFLDFYNQITKYDIFEGLVLKMKDGKLDHGSTEANNTRTQLKCRKKTKNYSF